MTVEKLEKFIDQNLDYLYENRTKGVLSMLSDGQQDIEELLKNPEFTHIN